MLPVFGTGATFEHSDKTYHSRRILRDADSRRRHPLRACDGRANDNGPDRHLARHCCLPFILGKHLEGKHIGLGVTAEAGFILAHDPDPVRAPDVAFLSRARFPSGKVSEGFGDFAPDLVVKVVSPYDRANEINEKLAEYFLAGTRLAWVVYPNTRSVIAYRSIREVEVLFEGDELDGKPVFEDFHVDARELFE